jgi:hypothetical protein
MPTPLFSERHLRHFFGVSISGTATSTCATTRTGWESGCRCHERRSPEPPIHLSVATRVLSDALSRDASDPDLATKLAYLLRVQDDAATAWNTCEELSRHHPKDPGVRMGLAECARRASDANRERESIHRAERIFVARDETRMLEQLGVR